MHLRYCLQGSFDCNEHRHPQEVLKSLGITYQRATPQSMADSWWFWNCENVPTDLPEFIKEMNNDPMQCIGHGLTQEMAEKIRDKAST